MRRLGSLALAWSLIGCASAPSSAPPPPGPAEPPAAPPISGPCPTVDTEVALEACADLPADHGLAPERPLEWGGAGSNTFFFGRIVCEGGGWPSVERIGSAGPAPVKSASPPGMPNFGVDVLDLWKVVCPGGRRLDVYTNMYRCGRPCPPAGLRLLSAARGRAYLDSRAAAERRDFAEAARIAEAGFPQGARTEKEASWLGLVYAADNRIDDAIAALTRAHEIDPADPYHLFHRAAAARKRGDLEAYFADLLAALERADHGHPLRPELLCLSRSYFERAGELARARDVGDEACKLGFARCCAPPGGAARGD